MRESLKLENFESLPSVTVFVKFVTDSNEAL